MKKTIQFILNKPQLSENVGMSLRSIGCFGFENLSLVSPRKIWPNDKGIKSAKHFSSLVKKVKVYQSIPEAMKGSDILIATTVRKRDFHIPPIKVNEILFRLQYVKLIFTYFLTVELSYTSNLYSSVRCFYNGASKQKCVCMCTVFQSVKV